MGLRLSVPTFKTDPERDIQKPPAWVTLRFSGKKTKLSNKGAYIKNFNLGFNKGDRILVYSDNSYGKTTLARVVTGQKCIDSLNVTLDRYRVPSKKWCFYKSENYFIKANPTFDITLGEYLLGESKSQISRYDIDAVYKELKPYKIFDFIFDHKDMLGRRITTANLSITEIILIQIAYCLLRPKSIIAIDHTCFDQSKNEIIEGIKLLEKHSKSTTFVFFSSKVNKMFDYAKIYNLDKTEFKQV